MISAARIVLITAISSVCLIPWKATAQKTPTQSTDIAPVGLFFFDGYERLLPQNASALWVRTAIEWGPGEPRPGNYIIDERNPQLAKIDELFSRGANVIPSIRSKSPWAVENPHGSKCASAPRDLDRKAPLKNFGIYSASYYHFVRRIAERYADKFEIVVIENEMNDEKDFWCSSIDDYLRLFSTAKRAFSDAKSKAKLADGGIQGFVLNWLVIDSYISRGNIDAAVGFYARALGETIAGKKLAHKSRTMNRKPVLIRAKQLLSSDLFGWADIINFHYYQQAEALPEVVAFIRAHTPAGKQLMTNEIGIKTRFSGDSGKACAQMIKKFGILAGSSVRPIIWFSPPGRKEHNAGALVDAKRRSMTDATSSFQAIANFLKPACAPLGRIVEQGHDGNAFLCGNNKLYIVWPKMDNIASFKQKENCCERFDYRGNRINNELARSQETPVFIVCSEHK